MSVGRRCASSSCSFMIVTVARKLVKKLSEEASWKALKPNRVLLIQAIDDYLVRLQEQHINLNFQALLQTACCTCIYFCGRMYYKSKRSAETHD